MKKYLRYAAFFVLLLFAMTFYGCGSGDTTGNGFIDTESWTNTGLKVSGYKSQGLTFDTENDLLYAGFAEVVDPVGLTESRGIWKYDGNTWTDTGFPVSECYVHSIACGGKNDYVYASCYVEVPGEISSHEPRFAGVWKYNGDEWTDMGVPEYLFRESGALAYDSSNNMLYASFMKTPTIASVWKHDGKRWADVGGDLSDYMVTTLVCDGESNLVYAGTRGNGGVLKFDGTGWTNTGGGLSGFWINSLVYDNANNVLYASTGSGTAQVEHFGHGVWKYDGANWVDTGGEVSSYSTGTIAVDSVNNVIYTHCFQDMGGRGIWKYDGTEWKVLIDEIPNFRLGGFAYDPDNNLLYTGFYDNTFIRGVGVWKYHLSKADL